MEMQKIEGISPDMLWTFMVVLVGLAALFVLGSKVIDIIRKERERKRNRQQLNDQDVTEEIATKVTERLTEQIEERFKKFDARFESIDKKLAADKQVLEMHTTEINQQRERVDRIETDNKAMCHALFALLSHEINGNSIDKLQKAHDAMRDYLIDGKYREEDWR